ncbi:TetR/AcrR family transcriptional regulator [Azospirillum sp. ST 5-10]|uniref:TetR/AcrR family transcriptional regulator n=1 Tax=unclassified Azospirillum TaxID=2630922 RepID=UPI003F4A704B
MALADGAGGPDPSARADEGSTEARILEAATRLFCREGIHATGIDRILAEAGSAKMSLYKHFGSKVGLVHAVLQREGDLWRSWFTAALERHAGEPATMLVAVFDVLGEWFAGEDYFGCAFINAVAEHDKRDEDIRALALAHKKQVLGVVRQLAAEAGAERPDELTHQLGLLMDGAIVAALVTGDSGVARHARAAAAVLVEASCRRRPAAR